MLIQLVSERLKHRHERRGSYLLFFLGAITISLSSWHLTRPAGHRFHPRCWISMRDGSRHGVVESKITGIQPSATFKSQPLRNQPQTHQETPVISTFTTSRHAEFTRVLKPTILICSSLTTALASHNGGFLLLSGPGLLLRHRLKDWPLLLWPLARRQLAHEIHRHRLLRLH